MNKLSIEIARHAGRVRRYERKLEMRRRRKDLLFQQRETMKAQQRALGNATHYFGGASGSCFSGASNVSPFEEFVYCRYR